MIELTERQAMVLAFLRDHIVTHQRPPTLREIGARFGWTSTNAITDHLKAIERKGAIVRRPSIRILGARLVWVDEPSPVLTTEGP